MTMKHLIRNALVFIIVGCIATAALGGEAIQIRLKDGSRWRGEVSNLVELEILQQGIEVELKGRIIKAAAWYITIEGDIAGETGRKTIFKGDILAIRTVQGEAAADAVASTADGSTARGAHRRADSTEADPNQPGVFVLPLENTVGIYLRHEEIEKIAEEADKYGPGQTIVFIIDSPGGMVTETETIHQTLTDIKKRHRLVAWIREAISAACATALHCHEIYFMTEGSAGAMTAYSGQTALKDEKLEEWLRRAGDWAEQGGRSRYIAEAMIHAPKMVSYDKDPETGEVTIYNDLSGEFVLSDEKNNLVFTATQAVHSGFADGIADTEEELAQRLDLPKWYEISDYGRKIAKKWYQTVERAQVEIPRTIARLSYYKEGVGDPVVSIGAKIQLYKELKDWHDACPNVARMRIPWTKDDIDRTIAELRKQLADLKKAQRGGGRY